VRGRIPKPTAIRRLEGNPGHRTLNRREPRPIVPPTKPDFIVGAAAVEWDRAVAAMPDGVFTSADSPVLAIYCVGWAIFRASLAEVARRGTTARGSHGQEVVSPHLFIATKERELILRAASLLGMSPAARAGLALDDPPESEDRFLGLWGPFDPPAA
jgi:P27 family predicted phage terminase small subunit